MRVVGLVVVLGAAGCSPTPYTVTQVGVVPAVRPMAYDGQPLDGTRIEGRSTTVLTDVDAEDEGGNSGLYVARHHSSVAIRGGRYNTDVGLELDAAWVKGSQPISPGLGPRPGGDAAIGIQFAARHSFPIDEQFRVGAGMTVGWVNVPIRVGNNANSERDEAAQWALAVVPSWRTGNLTLFAGAALALEVDVPGALVVDDSFDAPEAHSAGGVFVLSAGGTMSFDSGLRLTGQLARPVGGQIADYGAQLDLMIGFDFGARGSAPPPAPPAPPPASPPGAY